MGLNTKWLASVWVAAVMLVDALLLSPLFYIDVIGGDVRSIAIFILLGIGLAAVLWFYVREYALDDVFNFGQIQKRIRRCAFVISVIHILAAVLGSFFLAMLRTNNSIIESVIIVITLLFWAIRYGVFLVFGLAAAAHYAIGN